MCSKWQSFERVCLREASTLRFEGRIPTFLKRCSGDYAGEGNVPQSVVLCDATIVSADYLAVVYRLRTTRANVWK